MKGQAAWHPPVINNRGSNITHHLPLGITPSSRWTPVVHPPTAPLPPVTQSLLWLKDLVLLLSKPQHEQIPQTVFTAKLWDHLELIDPLFLHPPPLLRHTLSVGYAFDQQLKAVLLHLCIECRLMHTSSHFLSSGQETLRRVCKPAASPMWYRVCSCLWFIFGTKSM